MTEFAAPNPDAVVYRADSPQLPPVASVELALAGTEAGTALAYLHEVHVRDETMLFEEASNVRQLDPVMRDGVTHYPFVVDFGHEGDRADIVVADYVDGAPVGYGQVGFWKQADGTVGHEPYVVYTETDEAHRRKGYGLERLVTMNELSLQQFGRLLHSSEPDAIAPEERAVWQKLVEQGRAEEYKKDDSALFRFKAAGEKSDSPQERRQRFWEHYTEVKQNPELLALFDRTSVVLPEKARELLETNGYPERSKISELDMGNWQVTLDPRFIKDGFMYLMRGDNPVQGEKGFYAPTYGYGRKNTAQLANEDMDVYEVPYSLYGEEAYIRSPQAKETTIAAELAYRQGATGHSSFISTTTDLDVAKVGTGNQATKETRATYEVYVLKVPVDSVINNPYTHHYGVAGETEYLVPDFVSPDEVVARFPRDDVDGITKFLADKLGLKPEYLARPKD